NDITKNYFIHKNLRFNNFTVATIGHVYPTRPSVITKSDSTIGYTYPTRSSVTTKSDSTADASPPTAATTIFKFIG
ncbi:hypothetical protein MKX01_024161, partial [Papaver californicum]